MSEMISIVVNGETRELLAGVNVTQLLEALGVQGGRVAIEWNMQILPRASWAETQVGAGDRFEIVQFVGGG
jgi:thiazole synthase/sulfur carrier protein